jgi:Tfp pilus assembly protein PilP
VINGFYMMVVLFILCVTSVAAQTPPVPMPDGATDNGTPEENAQVAKALEELLASMKMENFVYQVEDRPDPFMPFISAKVIQPVESDMEDSEKLTGMRQFEPGQLNLVAILFSESNPLAMVEDSSHKGYIIKRGTKIGKSGIVSDILPNEVIIKQLSYSMTKERKYKTVELILRKEGEKQ